MSSGCFLTETGYAILRLCPSVCTGGCRQHTASSFAERPAYIHTLAWQRALFSPHTALYRNQPALQATQLVADVQLAQLAEHATQLAATRAVPAGHTLTAQKKVWVEYVCELRCVHTRAKALQMRHVFLVLGVYSAGAAHRMHPCG